jgi:hypothetical protein
VTNRVALVLAFAIGVAAGAAGYAFIVRPTPVETAGHVVTTPAASTTAEPLPEIPVSLGYVEARSGRGYLVQVHNQSQKHLAVLVEIENKTMSQKRSFPLELAPGQLVELGGTPEWIFVSGEVVTVKLDGYETKAFQIP